MQAQKFTETRSTHGIKVTADRHFFYNGLGHFRHEYNDGQPDVLNAKSKKSLHTVSGHLPGIVKVTPIAGTFGKWFSLRSIGPKGNGVTVYVLNTALTVVDGSEQHIGTLYSRNS